MSEPRYTRAEQRERMADFERHVRKARAAWCAGRAYVIMSFKEYLELSARNPVRSRRTPTKRGAHNAR